MSYSSEVLADSPLGYWTLGDSLVSPTGLLASSAAVAESQAVDGDPSRQWSAASSVTAATFRVQFPSSTVLTKYAIRRFDLASTRDPKDWTFEGSNNGSSWTTLDTRTGITWPTAGQTQTFTFSNSTAYTYYRLNISAVQTGGDRANLADFTLVFVGDSSGNSREVGAFGGLTFGATGPVSGTTACTFDGSTGYLYKTPESWMNVSAITVEAWVKTSNTSANQPIIVRDLDPTRSFQLRINAGKLEYLTIGGAAGTVTAQYATGIADGTWHHVAATYDASNIKLYVDGSLVVTQAASGALPNDTASSLLIGCHNRSSPLLFNGSIGHVAYYGSALTGTRIGVHYSAASGPSNVSAPAASLALDAPDPTIPTAAPTASLTLAAPAPTLPAPGINAPTAALALAAAAPTLPVVAPTAALALAGQVPFIVGSNIFPPTAPLVLDANPPIVNGVFTSMQIHGAGTIDITDAREVVITRMEMHGAGRVNMRLPRDWDADPRTGRPQWKYVLADMPTKGGALKCQLQVVADPHDHSIDEMSSGTFAVRTLDPKRNLIEPVTTWLHIYRGRHHMGGGPILPNPSTDGSMTTYQWRDPRWLVSGDFRPIKQIPRRGLLRNPEFNDGLNWWTGGFDPGTIPAAKPIVSIVDSEFEPGGKALEIRGADKTQLITQEAKTGAVFAPNSATYLGGGEAFIQAIGANIPNGSKVQITGHTANDGTGSGLTLSHNRALAAKATLTAMGKGFTFVQPSTASYKAGTFTAGGSVVGRGFFSPVASNSTPAGMAANRRVVIAYEGTQTALSSAQWEKQTVRVTADPHRASRMSPVGEFKVTEWIGPNLPGLAAKVTVVKVGESAPLENGGTADVKLTADTPRDRLVSTTELEGNLDVEIPAGTAQYDVTLYLYAPAGEIHWEWADIYPDDGLFFYDVDQADIVKGIVEHAQDPAKGWAALGIATRTPLTGVKRKREYYYSLQRPTDVALTEFTALWHGMNISCEVLPSGATIVTHYPRQGTTSGLVLASPGNVVAWEPATSRDVASLIIAQADGNGIARPEKYAWDDSALGGLRLAGIVNAENETPLNELGEFASLELRRAKVTVPAYWLTIHPRAVSEVYDRLSMGDTARVSIPVFDGAARAVKFQPDPNSDGLRVMVVRED